MSDFKNAIDTVAETIQNEQARELFLQSVKIFDGYVGITAIEVMLFAKAVQYFIESNVGPADNRTQASLNFLKFAKEVQATTRAEFSFMLRFESKMVTVLNELLDGNTEKVILAQDRIFEQKNLP